MTVASIGSLTAPQQKLDAGALIGASVTANTRELAMKLESEQPTAREPTAVAPTAAQPTEEQRKVARDFEAIFMRQLLGSMEKAGGFGGESNSSGAMYRSMMVGALADTAAEGGGIGLAELILKAMLPPVTPSATTAVVNTAVVNTAVVNTAVVKTEAASTTSKGTAPQGVSQRNSR
jgi:flagellar protein FlgJ